MRNLTRGFGFRSGIHACLCAAVLGACGSERDRPVFSVEPEQSSTFTCLISNDQIFDGGVGRDGIPALDFPVSAAAPAATGFMHDTMRVIGVEVNGAARAYPLFLLWWHELVNDTLGGRPILVSYCPLTGSGLAFDPEFDGKPRIFGVSGLLFENNLMMFDRESESLWVQLLMGAQCGPKRGTPLFRIPVVETTWGHWKTLHPTTAVITDETGYVLPYGKYPYGNYDEPDNDVTLLPSSPWSRRRPPKELTLGVRAGLAASAYPFGLLEELGSVAAVNDQVGAQPILVTWVGAAQTARAFARRVGGRELSFDVADAAKLTFRDRETGSTWDARGEAVSGPLQGERLTPLEDAWTLFWFAWSVYYPGTHIFSPRSGTS